MKYQPIKFKFKEYPMKDIKKRSEEFYKFIKKRRSIRSFRKRNIDDNIIKNAILAAGSSPNGANLQPWHFVVIKDNSIKKKIKIAAENEEFNFYKHKASVKWLEALKPLGTNPYKDFLIEAPLLIAIFEQKFTLNNNIKIKNYYVKESVGIATGILISCLHYSGLSMLTHTPSPMTFLNKILKRPNNEKPFVLLVVGLPSKNCTVPKFAIQKKTIKEISTWV